MPWAWGRQVFSWLRKTWVTLQLAGTETGRQPLLGRRSLPAHRDAKTECNLGRQSLRNSGRKGREGYIKREASSSVPGSGCCAGEVYPVGGSVKDGEAAVLLESLRGAWSQIIRSSLS